MIPALWKNEVHGSIMLVTDDAVITTPSFRMNGQADGGQNSTAGRVNSYGSENTIVPGSFLTRLEISLSELAFTQYLMLMNAGFGTDVALPPTGR